MTLERLKEALEYYLDSGFDPNRDVCIQIGKVDMDPVPVRTVSHDDGQVILCDLEEY
jgi:hypothetical protein